MSISSVLVHASGSLIALLKHSWPSALAMNRGASINVWRWETVLLWLSYSLAPFESSHLGTSDLAPVLAYILLPPDRVVMQVFLMPPTPIHNFHSSITWVAKNTTGLLLHSLLVYTQVRLQIPKHSLKYSQTLTAHMNESPTNNPLKYIQAVKKYASMYYLIWLVQHSYSA